MNDIILGNAIQCLCKVNKFNPACPHATATQISLWSDRIKADEESLKERERQALEAVQGDIF